MMDYTFVWLDAMTQRCREDGHVVNVVTVIATGVNSDGHREILGVDVFTSEDGAGWSSFLRNLVERDLRGVKLVISDAHSELKAAIAEQLPGSAWQRFRNHFMCNLLNKVPHERAGPSSDDGAFDFCSTDRGRGTGTAPALG